MNIHLSKVHVHIKTHHKKYLLAGAIGGVGFFALKALFLLFGIAGIFQRNRGAYAMDSNICNGVSVASGGVSQSECEALVGIYNSTQGDGWSIKSSRGNTGSICSWYGVGCSAGSVSSLNLSNNTLAGSIDLSGLPNIESLDLSKNLMLIGISGLGSLSNLTSLDITNIGSSSYPDGISSLSNLETISLQSNGYNSFPPVGGLTYLRSINVAGNNLNVSSIDLSSLGSLDSLNLSNNDFTSAPSISNSNITTLNLANNTSMTSISNLSSLSSLTTLDVSNCYISNAGLGGFESLSLSYGNVTNNCLTIYEITAAQNPAYTLYDYLVGHSVSYNPQKACGNIYDGNPPVCSVDYYSPSSWTRDGVTAYLTCTKPVNESLTHTFYSNGDYTFNLSNTLYNWSDTVYTEVTWIDIDPPVCSAIQYDTYDNYVTAYMNCTDRSPSSFTISNNYTANGPMSLTAYDDVGNSTTLNGNITTYIPDIPECQISYSTTSRTSGNVTATLYNCISNNMPITYLNGSSYEFNSNGSYTFQFRDGDNDNGSALATVSNIDKLVPTCSSVSYSPSYIPGVYITGNVLATLIGCSDSPSGINGSSSHTSYNFTDAGTHTLYVVDNAGNRTDYTAEVTWIDKGAPTCNLSYSTIIPTSGNVTAMLTGCNEAVTVTNTINGGSGYDFINNGSFTFRFVDTAGNTGSILATVDNIDRVAPTCNPNIIYNPISGTPTNSNVIAMLSGCTDTGSVGTHPSIVGINSSSSYTGHIFTDNGSYTLYIVDRAGNKSEYMSTVTWIDKTKPICGVSHSITGSFTDKTNQNVLSTLTGCSEPVTVISPVGGTGEYLFTGNGNFTFQYIDAAGNTGSYTDTVYRIDTDKPRCVLSYDPSSATSGNVLVTLSQCSKVNLTVTNNNGSTGYLFTGNGNFTFQYRDASGNTGFTVATVTWIDREKPICAIDYSPGTNTSQDVTASIGLCSKTPITVTNNNGSTGYLFTGNGNFTFQYRDASGNTGSTVATVTWIDRTKPVCAINYSPGTSTSQDVTASIGLCSKTPIIVTNNNSSNNYLFTGNGNFTFQYRDALGNTGFTLATVTWINRGGGGGGGGGGITKDKCLDGDFSPSFYDGICKEKESHSSASSAICKVEKPYKFSIEQVTAFQRAYSLGITTMCPIDKAGLNSNLIRKHMAKMISEFAMDVIGVEPDTSKRCNFLDISKETVELQSYIKLSCQLGLMGYHTDGITKKDRFDPNKVVTRAQFSAILSRLIRGTKYAGGSPYYKKHAKALKDNQIMDKSINVFMTPQIRGPMIIMLMKAKIFLDNLDKSSIHTSAALTGSAPTGPKSSK